MSAMQAWLCAESYLSLVKVEHMREGIVQLHHIAGDE